MQLIATDTPSVVIGMGLTGLACARFLSRLNQSFVLMDTRETPPLLNQAKALQDTYPKMSIQLGELDAESLMYAKQIIVSPGIAKNHPAIEKAKAAGVNITGDVQLFLDHLRNQSAEKNTPIKIIGVTGSNGKSTVVSALGLACKAAGLNTIVAGNIGVPVLDLLDGSPLYDVYVLELSSFQLELVQRASLDVACVLNVSADHMDRYPSLAHYCQAKLRIYFGAKNIVYNVDDMLTIPPLMENVNRYGFSLKRPIEENQKPIFVNEQKELVIEKNAVAHIDQFTVKGEHNIENMLAVLGLLHSANISVEKALPALFGFGGLAHRCEVISHKNGVAYINDSKATNIGAAIAAIKSLKSQCERIILIAGGNGKGADFSPFAKVIIENVAYIILIGMDAKKIEQALNSVSLDYSDFSHVKDINSAVKKAADIAKQGDIVLLSPACASLDMFASFEQRGQAFSHAVEALTYA